MKSILLTSTILAAMAGAASAEVSFGSAIIDVSYLTPTDSSFSFGSFGGRADYDIGQFGLQVDGSASMIISTGLPFELYSAAAHVYKPLGNGAKVGGFASFDSFYIFGISTSIYSVGAEGMMSFGALDIEASIANIWVGGTTSSAWFAAVDAYYSVGQAIELRGGVSSLFVSAGTTTTTYTVGAQYTMASIPLSLGANYQFDNGWGSEFVEIVASYAFGPRSDERLFSNHNYPVFQGGL